MEAVTQPGRNSPSYNQPLKISYKNFYTQTQAVNRHACVDLSRKTRMSKAHTKKYQQQKHFSFED
jgi:hypothetical protein